MKMKGIRVGMLRKWLSLQKRTYTEDGIGGSSDTWAEIAKVWGAIMPISARELAFAAKLEVRGTHRILIRWRADIDTNGDHKLVLVENPDREFNIRSVIDVEERQRYLEIVAEEGVAQ